MSRARWVFVQRQRGKRDEPQHGDGQTQHVDEPDRCDLGVEQRSVELAVVSDGVDGRVLGRLELAGTAKRTRKLRRPSPAQAGARQLRQFRADGHRRSWSAIRGSLRVALSAVACACACGRSR
jgi:hypothetical protein